MNALRKQRLYRLVLLSALIVIVLPATMYNILIAVQTLAPHLVYQKDLFQDYLLGAAYWHSLDPYLPLAELAREVFGPQAPGARPYPSPHPPSLVVFLPLLARLPYEQAAAVWLLGELLFLALIALMLDARMRLPLLGAIGIFLAVLASRPMQFELMLGQFSVLITALLAVFLSAMCQQRQVLAGAALGVALCIKLLGLPLVALLLLKKKYQSAVTALAVWLSANAAFCLLYDKDYLFRYYQNIAPKLSSLFTQHWDNQSLWTIGARLFQGLESGAEVTASAPPLVSAPALAPVVSVLCIALVSLAVFYRAWRSEDLEFSIVIVLALTPLILPTFWIHGLVLYVLLLPLVARRWSKLACSKLGGLQQVLWVLSAILLLFGDAPRRILLAKQYTLSFAQGLISAVPLASCLLVLLLLAVMPIRDE